MPDFAIRPALPADAAELAEINSWYVENTAVSFAYTAPSEAFFTARMANAWPFFVAEADGSLLGYAYAGPFHEKEAYRFCAEMTVYLRPQERGHGVGRALYTALEDALRARGMRSLYACIGWPDEPDEYLTRASAAFHERMGYRQCGYFPRCGYKFGRWYSMIWMVKQLADGSCLPPAEKHKKNSQTAGKEPPAP